MNGNDSMMDGSRKRYTTEGEPIYNSQSQKFKKVGPRESVKVEKKEVTVGRTA